MVDHGGVVRGAVSIANVAHHRVRRVEIDLVVSERAKDRTVATFDAQRYGLKIHEGAPIEGEAIPFNVMIPKEAPRASSARSSRSAGTW